METTTISILIEIIEIEARKNKPSLLKRVTSWFQLDLNHELFAWQVSVLPQDHYYRSMIVLISIYIKSMMPTSLILYS